MAYHDQINDFRNGFRTVDARRNADPYEVHDGPVSAYKTGEAVGEEIAQGDLGGAVEAATDEPSTMPASEKPESAKELEEKNAAILRGKDERPPRAGEGISRAAGGVAQGAGAAAAGIGEGAGSVAKGAGEAVEAVGHAAKRVASVGEDARLRSNTEHQNAYVTDASMSWGRAGQTETTRERGAEKIPAPALQSCGIAPGDVTQTSPTPEVLPGPSGSRFEPDGDHSTGTWNMSEISSYRIG